MIEPCMRSGLLHSAQQYPPELILDEFEDDDASKHHQHRLKGS